MISKKSPRRRDGRSSFKRLADYLLDKKHGGEKVLWQRLSHCLADDPELAVKEVLATQALNRRARSDKTYHLIISFRAGEKPPPEQLITIEERFCQALGLAGHQRLSVAHADTDNLHLHVAINKVHPQTLTLVEPYRDYWIRDRVCQELEREYGLAVDNHRRQPERSRAPPAGHMEAHAGLESFQGWIRGEPAQALGACLDRPDADWNALHAVLALYDLELRPRGAGLVLADRGGKGFVKASALSRRFGKAALEKRLGAFQASESARQIKANGRYEAAPLHVHNARKALYRQYQDHRQGLLAGKRRQLQALGTQRRQRLEAIRERFGQRRQAVKADPLQGRGAKRARYSLLKMQRLAEVERLQAELRTERQAIHAGHRIPTWQAYLVEQANEGNLTALELLRSTRRRVSKGHGENRLQGVGGEPQPLLLQNFRYRVHANGDVSYVLASGGGFRDEGRLIRMNSEDLGAVEAAVRLAQLRFGGHLGYPRLGDLPAPSTGDRGRAGHSWDHLR